MNRIIRFATGLICLWGSGGVLLANVAVLKDDAPKLINPSFEEPGETTDRAAGWGRWGDWFNREEGWTPVHSGHCILGYHHWEIPNANDSGVYQDVKGATQGVAYTFGIYVNADKARDAAKDALTIEMRLESTMDGRQRTVASKVYKAADLKADQWEKLTVSGAPANDTFRVLVIVTPSPENGTRGGALRFDDASLGPAN